MRQTFNLGPRAFKQNAANNPIRSDTEAQGFGAVSTDHEQPSSSQGYPRLDDRYLITVLVDHSTVLELLKLISGSNLQEVAFRHSADKCQQSRVCIITNENATFKVPYLGACALHAATCTGCPFLCAPGSRGDTAEGSACTSSRKQSAPASQCLVCTLLGSFTWAVWRRSST